MERESIVSGLVVSKGTVTGRARMIHNTDELYGVEDGDIVVLPESHPMYGIAVLKAGGIICEHGGKLSHICIVSLEMGIPCLTQVKDAMVKIKDGATICLDGEKGCVYECAEGDAGEV